MMKLLNIGLAAIALCAPAAHAEVKVAEGLKAVEVFTPKKDGHPHFRIPAIVTSQKGTLLVFAEGRVRTHDHARNDIVLKRSEDNGETWSDVIVVDEDKDLVMVNPSPLVLESGRILVFYETFPHGYHGRKEHDIKMMSTGYEQGLTQRFLVRSSDDDGKTWSKPLDLTRVARADSSDIRNLITAGSPANAIQLTRGRYKGRIVVPLFLVKRITESKREIYNGVLYSDDNCRTWKRSRIVPIEGTNHCNEALIAELDDGSVMMNARPGRTPLRAVSVSRDGGQTWSPFVYDQALKGRNCNCGLLKYSYADEGKSRLFFSHNFHNKKRANGHLKLSYDNGKTWPVSKQVVPGWFGYSQLTKMKDGSIGMIFEPFQSPKEPWTLQFVRIPLEWIEG
ncbi:sialidase family protein [Sulfuriroseicoccus oceanibius]|uniref:exo-alpha-sialidase n=1 Tax=Sulfuriroseicoccus oceanibius TaxID=2707525 RepID=A0A6B3LEF5_9BACT|nr:sialidase family protein [Sulfuriroseicoccus oceanibius]QQL44735.1 exo-alpha-sialidase [Sulfuriroseicoccus oceanibius]